MLVAVTRPGLILKLERSAPGAQKNAIFSVRTDINPNEHIDYAVDIKMELLEVFFNAPFFLKLSTSLPSLSPHVRLTAI